MKGLTDNKLYSIWKWFFDSLISKYDEKELKSIRRIFFSHFFNLNETDIIIKKEILFSESDIVKVIKGIQKLERYTPIQYITGKAYFLEHEFTVNSEVLIPRQETEELVLLMIELINKKFRPETPVRIIDIGTGSGCIAISLANKLQNAVITGVDISKKALDIAAENAQIAGVKINIKHHDILTCNESLGAFDVVISNPPYVRFSEKELMHKNVLDYEPENALFVSDENPLLFYNKILKISKSGMLSKKGLIAFEINENLAEETVLLIKSMGFRNVITHKDFRGKQRFITAENS